MQPTTTGPIHFGTFISPKKKRPSTLMFIPRLEVASHVQFPVLANKVASVIRVKKAKPLVLSCACYDAS